MSLQSVMIYAICAVLILVSALLRAINAVRIRAAVNVKMHIIHPIMRELSRSLIRKEML